MKEQQQHHEQHQQKQKEQVWEQLKQEDEMVSCRSPALVRTLDRFARYLYEMNIEEQVRIRLGSL